MDGGTHYEKDHRFNIFEPRRRHASARCAVGGSQQRILAWRLVVPLLGRPDGQGHGGLAENYDLLLGRKTYEIFAAHWPFAGDNPVTHRFNEATKYVASRTLEKLEWQNSTLLGKDVAADVKKLKSGNGPDLQVHGSSVLLQTLNNAQLVDEYRLWIFPVVIGHGKRLFAEGAVPQDLKLTDSKVASTGVMINTYHPAGAVKPGSFALDNPTAAERARREKMAREG
jgi:dihydrofolate reductase